MSARDQLQKNDFNIAYIIDTSGSMASSFSGSENRARYEQGWIFQ